MMTYLKEKRLSKVNAIEEWLVNLSVSHPFLMVGVVTIGIPVGILAALGLFTAVFGILVSPFLI